MDGTLYFHLLKNKLAQSLLLKAAFEKPNTRGLPSSILKLLYNLADNTLGGNGNGQDAAKDLEKGGINVDQAP